MHSPRSRNPATTGTETRFKLPDMVALPAGSFLMGNDTGRNDERPAHQVTLAPFRAATKPVSNREYAFFLAATGHPDPLFWQAEGFSAGEQPVVAVSWYDAMAYCDWLNRLTGIGFRLPTEAEREYAARGGIEKAEWPSDATPDFAGDIGGLEHPHVPSLLCRNAYGLYCMAENVHEWCSDWYDASYYAVSPQESPPGPGDAKLRRSSRGGSWRHSVKFTRVSARSSLKPDYRYNDYGFRLFADGG